MNSPTHPDPDQPQAVLPTLRPRMIEAALLSILTEEFGNVSRMPHDTNIAALNAAAEAWQIWYGLGLIGRENAAMTLWVEPIHKWVAMLQNDAFSAGVRR